jgi:hypothetical protein
MLCHKDIGLFVPLCPNTISDIGVIAHRIHNGTEEYYTTLIPFREYLGG